MHARSLFKKSGSGNHNKVPVRSRLLATVLLLGACIFLLARTFSWQKFAFGASSTESSYISGLCTEFLNWAPGSEFLPRAQRLTASGYPASSFHNIIFGIVSSVDNWPGTKNTALSWWRTNVTRGFVFLENGERSLQLQQKQEEEELLEQRRQVERDHGEVAQGKGQTGSRSQKVSGTRTGSSNGTLGADSNLVKEVDLERLTIGRLAERLAEGYGQEPILQVHTLDQSPHTAQLDSLASALLRLAAQDVADVHWFVMIGEDAIFDIENLAGVLNR